MTATPVAAIYSLPVASIVVGPSPRTALGDLSALTASIRALGQRHPIIVAGDPSSDRYEIFDGARRLAACHALGHTHVAAVIRPRLTGTRRLLVQLSLHVHARPYDPITEARTLHALIDGDRLPVASIADATGCSTQWITDRLALLHLPRDIQALVARRELPVRDAVRFARNHCPSRKRTPSPRRARHFGPTHPLAAAAYRACIAAGHNHSYKGYRSVCDSSWEAAVRADERDRQAPAPDPAAHAPSDALVLDPIERTVFQLLIAGLTHAQVAAHLGLSRSTIRRRVLLPVCERIGATGLQDALARLVAAGVLSAPSSSHQASDARNRDILRLIATGHTNSAISSALGISKTALEARIHHLYLTHRLQGRRALSAWATSQGIVAPADITQPHP